MNPFGGSHLHMAAEVNNKRAIITLGFRAQDAVESDEVGFYCVFVG